MTKILTDSEGNKFERIGDLTYLNEPHSIVIKPIPKAVEKKDYRLAFGLDALGEQSLVYHEYDLTEPQAQAISDMLEAALEYVQTPKRHTGTASDMLAESSALAALQEKAMATRAALQEDI